MRYLESDGSERHHKKHRTVTFELGKKERLEEGDYCTHVSCPSLVTCHSLPTYLRDDLNSRLKRLDKTEAKCGPSRPTLPQVAATPFTPYEQEVLCAIGTLHYKGWDAGKF